MLFSFFMLTFTHMSISLVLPCPHTHTLTHDHLHSSILVHPPTHPHLLIYCVALQFPPHYCNVMWRKFMLHSFFYVDIHAHVHITRVVSVPTHIHSLTTIHIHDIHDIHLYSFIHSHAHPHLLIHCVGTTALFLLNLCCSHCFFSDMHTRVYVYAHISHTNNSFISTFIIQSFTHTPTHSINRTDRRRRQCAEIRHNQ